ncbi:MAG: hypothetical protein AAGI24_13520 [Pseudomonadota bacterium]
MIKPLALAALVLSSLGTTALASVEQANTFLAVGDVDAAIETLEKQPKEAGAALLLAKIYLSFDADEAEDWIDSALKASPDDADVQFVYARVMVAQAQGSVFSALKYAKKARKAMTRAVELAPENITYLKFLMNFYLFAPSIAGGDTDKARELAEQLRGLDDVEGLLADFSIAQRQEDEVKQAAVLAEALKTHAGDSRVHTLAGFRQMQDEDYGAAFEQFLLATAEEASTEPQQMSYLTAIYQQGRAADIGGIHVEAGIQALEQYLTLAPYHYDLPSRDWASYRLANLLAVNGEKARAETIYASLKNTHNEKLRKELKAR